MSVALFATLALPLASGDARRWEDEIVYVVIIEKFFDGDPANDIMRDRFLKERDRYEGGFWGGDLKGVIAKLDDLTDLGITTLLLYPVMQNDENPVGKFLPTGYRPKDYEHVDRNFGDNATLRALVDAAHAREMHVILDMPLAMPGFEHPFLVDPAKRDWFAAPTEYGARRWKVENPEVADYLIGVCQALEGAIGLRRFPPRFRSSSTGFLLETLRRRAEIGATTKGFLALARAHDHPEKDRRVRDRSRF